LKQVQQLITNTVQQLGGVDIMVANAGKLSHTLKLGCGKQLH
jgi:NADP-dependent 3-hydroxy acid dehydrogenase YdfG